MRRHHVDLVALSTPGRIKAGEAAHSLESTRRTLQGVWKSADAVARASVAAAVGEWSIPMLSVRRKPVAMATRLPAKSTHFVCGPGQRGPDLTEILPPRSYAGRSFPCPAGNPDRSQAPA